MAQGNQDPSYTFATTNAPTYVVTGGYPVSGPRVPDASSPLSEWIGRVATQTDDCPTCAGGNFTYEQAFTVSGPGYVEISGRFAADNKAEILVDGIAVTGTGVQTFTFSQWTPFDFTVDLLTGGQHELEFQVGDEEPQSPTGLRVEFNGTAPEPSTFATLGAGLVIIGFIKRKRFGRPALN